MAAVTEWDGVQGKQRRHGLRVLKNFGDTAGDGSHVVAGLVFSGGTLYGTTELGGTDGSGTVFKVNSDGSGYAVIKSFGNTISDGGVRLGPDAYPAARCMG